MIFSWQKLRFILAVVLLYALHWSASLRETLLPGGDSYSLPALDMCRLDFTHCYSICWLLFHLTPCPFMSLLVIVLLTGFFYYTLLLACGYVVCSRHHKWRSYRRALSTVECLLMDMQLEGETGAPQEAIEPPPAQPETPPRRKRRQAPQPPAASPHPCQNNPFGSTTTPQCFTETPDPDIYRTMRQNLQRALDGLQKPLPLPAPFLLPLPMPEPLPLPTFLPQLDEPLAVSQSGCSVAQEKLKSRPKLLRGILKRLGISSKKSQRDKDSSSSSPIRPLWQRLRSRMSLTVAADTPANSSRSSTTDELLYMYPHEVRQRMRWKNSYT
ncbi:uncharacterized protein LOC117580529 [Drosophila guanche]|uniref:Uncharacterized protein n=1 Tax=Drosophila guanche TaxID=7266 RepID=A0A3B0J6R0_DROGU|nr:uncharacterized protein LOC117580529 [Drosophila guanche]SPP77415.1 Hypothetical predicted protein [Drosophila guanche]